MNPKWKAHTFTPPVLNFNLDKRGPCPGLHTLELFSCPLTTIFPKGWGVSTLPPTHSLRTWDRTVPYPSCPELPSRVSIRSLSWVCVATGWLCHWRAYPDTRDGWESTVGGECTQGMQISYPIGGKRKRVAVELMVLHSLPHHYELLSG